MKRFAFAACMLLGLVVTGPARADYSIIRFGDGRCEVWWDSAANPWGAGWTKIAVGLPDSGAAHAVLSNAISQRVCQ